MATRAESLRLGPFDGGLNLSSDPTSIADNELVQCHNLELDIDGTLVTRPTMIEAPNTTVAGLTVIGRGIFPGGASYLIAGRNTAEFGGIYVSTDKGVTWELVRDNLRCSVAVQYNGFIWLPARPGTKTASTNTHGGRWDPINGFVVDSNMPEGESAIFHKARMFIVPGAEATVNPSRVQFTATIESSTLSWPAENIIDISPGDGQNLVDMVVYNDNIMFFKTDSTYLLAYEVNPSEAILRTVNTVIGVSSRYCLVSYENSLFIYHSGKVYEILNYDFDHINIKIPFEIDNAYPEGGLVNVGNLSKNDVTMSLVGDRLVINIISNTYVYGLKTRSWSTWSWPHNDFTRLGPWVKIPSTEFLENPQYVTTSGGISATLLLYEKPGGLTDKSYSGSVWTDIPVVSYFETKHFDFADSHHFKKLMWWGVDVLAPSNVKGTLIPYAASTVPLWSSMQTQTWTQLSDNTWNQPLGTSGAAITNVTQQLPLIRTFVKFLKTIRFRMLGFKVEITHEGTASEGPVRVYSLTAMVSTKQTVGKQVN